MADVVLYEVAERIATLRHKELGLSVPTAFMTAEPG